MNSHVDKKSQLVLGTVQFGLPYGVTNTKGKVAFEEVVAILKCASANGVSILDSASTYGDSELMIGKAAKAAGLTQKFAAITKVHFSVEGNIETQVFAQIEKTLTDLNGIPLYGLMVHHAQQLLTLGSDLIKVLQKAKEKFAIPRIGVSVYNTEELVRISQMMNLDIVQIPYNVFNQSFTELDILKKLRKENCEVHARSIFLQGVLLANQNELKPYFGQFTQEFKNYHGEVTSSQINSLKFNLANALRQASLDKIVIGVTSESELKEIFNAVNSLDSINLPQLGHLSSSDERLINPANWKV